MKKILPKGLSAAVITSVLALGLCGSVWAEETTNAEAEVGDKDALTTELEFTLDTMIVTAGRVPARITDAKADISVVTRQQMEDMHLTNVEDALRTVPGVQMSSYGGPGGINSNINTVRINGSKDIVILVDGVRVSDFQGKNSGAVQAALMNNLDNIERIEVLRGSAGTLYGSAAKGGVINIITRKLNETKTTIDISGGSFNKRQYKLFTQGRQDKLGFNVYYDKSKIGDIKDGDGVNWPNKLDSEAYGTKISYDITDKHTLTLNVDKTKSDTHGYDLVYDAAFKGWNDGTTVSIRDDIQFSDKWSNTFTYRYNRSKIYYLTESDPTMDPMKDYTYNFISDQATFKTSRHTLVFGFDYSQVKDNESRRIAGTTADPVMGNYGLKNTSYYIQDDWQIIPKVTLTGGLRYDKLSNDGDSDIHDIPTHTSKSYKINWDITDNDSVYAGRSDFFKYPGLSELYDTVGGNPNLEPAYGRTTSIGYNKKFDEDHILTFNWFKTVAECDIQAIPVVGGTWTTVNTYGDVARGWNLQYMAHFSDQWSATLGWSHLFYHSDDGTVNQYSKYGFAPKDMATFNIMYNYAKVKAGLDGYYFMRGETEESDKKNAYPCDNYAIINLSGSYAPTKNITIYTRVNNLFDKLYAERTDAFWGGGAGSWYSMPGRSIVVGVQYTF